MKHIHLLNIYTVIAILAFTSCSTDTRQTSRQEALDFLYASMPLPDSVDYSRDFWLRNIDCALQARSEMPWGRTIPEREWRHFVLPARVNNENLDSCRWVFFSELKPRVEHLTMAEAILEVNHWCHEHVTYQPSDERTSSPLATIRTAYGRCGEESTLLVAALRSVGIPARQVYTPRWAHTDDNHAWVEAWADGEWHFLGACEPEPVLDLGWFNAPASRAMLMHTKVFGQYDGSEQVMQRNACFTEIDVTNHYAPVGRGYVQVLDEGGNPVKDASVEFKIYNYAEFYTVATYQTDDQGITSMQAGLGDLVCWASKEDAYGFGKIHIGSSDTLRLVLSRHPGERFSLDFELTPPAERNTLPSVSDEQRQTNTLRLAYEDSLRAAYVATFPTSDDPLLRASRGNHEVIRRFLQAPDIDGQPTSPALRRQLLTALSAKDLRDVTSDVLRDAFFGFDLSANDTADDFRMQYVVNPRVLNEGLRPYKAFFSREVSAEQQTSWRNNPHLLAEWIGRNISLDTLHNPQQLRMSPVGAFKARRCDATSRDILFVALARTCKIPARIDPVTRKLQVALKGSAPVWTDVTIEASSGSAAANVERPSLQGELSLTYSPTRHNPDPKYYTHFTLSRINHGTSTLLNYAESDTYRTLFGNRPLPLDSGDYLLVTGTRMANGSVLAHVEVFPILEDQTSRVPLQLRHADHGLQVIGSFNSENLYNDLKQGSKSLLSTTGRGYYILGIIASNHEPSNHALRDIAQCKDAFDQWGRPLVLLFRNEQEAARFSLPTTEGSEQNTSLPDNTYFGTDIDSKIINELCSELHLKDATLPLFIIADTFNRVVLLSEGYTIGLGEQLIKGINTEL